MLLILDGALIGGLVTRPFASITGRSAHVLLLAHPHSTPVDVQKMLARAKWSAWGWVAVFVPVVAVVAGGLTAVGWGIGLSLLAGAALASAATTGWTAHLKRDSTGEHRLVSPDQWSYAQIVDTVRSGSGASWRELWNSVDDA